MTLTKVCPIQIISKIIKAIKNDIFQICEEFSK